MGAYPGKSWESTDWENNFHKLRIGDKIKYTAGKVGEDLVELVLDQRFMHKRTAYISIARTFFVCFVLAAGTLQFNADVNEIALNPLENMIEKVNMIARDPLKSREI